MSLKTKLFSLVIFGILAILGIVYYSTQSLKDVSKTVLFFGNERLPLTALLGDVRAASNGIPRFIWLALANAPQSTARENSLKRVEDYLAEMPKSIERMEKFELLESSKLLLAGMKSNLQKLDEVVRVIIRQLRAGSTESDKLAKESLLIKMPPHAVKITDATIELSKGVTARNAAVLAETEKAVDTSYTTLLIFSSIGGLFFGITGGFVAFNLSKSLNSIAIAIGESSNQVASAASNIASASTSLSQATTEQAAALEETAASVEEMSSMVNKNSDNAKNASVTSIKSQEKAEFGNRVIERMIGSMDEITKSNNEISQIVKVIMEIGDKTKVINDIVFQTKLLSFNASVEAARAGEHGKGFAVVAEEVGNLAQMSGNASKEIAALLDGSIQKVESIVSETRQKVDAGSKVARECGEVLNEIVTNVINVSQMASEISSASQEQAQGIQEITKAMTQLDQVTQQNAATSEESSNEAKELSSQANSLNTAVGNLLTIVTGVRTTTDSSIRTTTPKSQETHTPRKKGNTFHLKVADLADENQLTVPSHTNSGFKDV